MTNRQMLDKYKEIIIAAMKITVLDTKILVNIGEALEKYMWMDSELKEHEKGKKGEDK